MGRNQRASYFLTIVCLVGGNIPFKSLKAAISEVANSDGFAVSGDMYVNDECNLNGIIIKYSTKSFVKSMLPAKKQGDLQSVSYDKKTKQLNIKLNKDRAMNCTEKEEGGVSTLSCRFDDLPLGLDNLSFTVSRSKDGERCLEKMETKGTANNWVYIIGTTPKTIHKDLAKAILQPYREAELNQAMAKQGAGKNSDPNQKHNRVAPKVPVAAKP